MISLDTVLQNTNDMEKRWNTYVAFPYSRAYSTALQEFAKTKGAQAALLKKKSDMGLLALSICSGGVLTHVFAQTTWKAVLSSKVMDVIYKNNMVEAFNTAHFIADNKVANFVVGELWNTGSRFLDAKTKLIFKETPASFPSTQKWQTETAALTSLMGFVNECYLKFRDVARFTFNRSYMTEADRKNAIDMLLNSRFANPPSTSSIDETKVAQEIELMFYLKIVMDLDYTQTFYQPVTPPRAGVPKPQAEYGNRVPINMDPHSSMYPTTVRKAEIIDHSGHVEGTLVKYKDLGRAFYDKINKLHTALFNGPLLTNATWDDWFNVDMNKQALMNAQTALKKLESGGMARFKQTLNARL